MVGIGKDILKIVAPSTAQTCRQCVDIDFGTCTERGRSVREEIQCVVGVLEAIHIFGRSYCAAIDPLFVKFNTRGISPKKHRAGIKTLNFTATGKGWF